MIENDAYLVIDAGGTYLKSAVLSKGGSIMRGSAFMAESFSGGSKEEILLSFRETISHGLTFIENAGRRLGGIGTAVPGPFDFSRGIPLMEHKFQNIHGINLRKAFSEIPGIFPHIPILFTHDVNAVLIGEMWKGNARGFENAAVITLGTGLGFAFSINKKIQCNDLGSPAIALYNYPYRDGIMEDFAAQRGIRRIYREITGDFNDKDIRVSGIGERADKGDLDCIRTFHEAGRILAENLVDILRKNNIRCLLVGGQISRSFHHMEKAMRQVLEDVQSLQKISPVRSINNAALLGALRMISMND